MNITLADIGEKLESFRKNLSLSQKDLATAIGVQQNQISRLENGLGGSIDLLLQLLNYYGNHNQVSFVIEEGFEIVENKREGVVCLKTSIAVEKLAMLEDDINTQLREVSKLLTS